MRKEKIKQRQWWWWPFVTHVIFISGAWSLRNFPVISSFTLYRYWSWMFVYITPLYDSFSLSADSCVVSVAIYRTAIWLILPYKAHQLYIVIYAVSIIMDYHTVWLLLTRDPHSYSMIVVYVIASEDCDSLQLSWPSLLNTAEVPICSVMEKIHYCASWIYPHYTLNYHHCLHYRY